MSNLANGREKFVTDILSMLKKESLNDVKIILEDGEIRANKDVLSARSDYFATMFSKATRIKSLLKAKPILSI